MYYLQLGLKIYEWKLRGIKKFLIRRRIWLGNRLLYYLYNMLYIIYEVNYIKHNVNHISPIYLSTYVDRYNVYIKGLSGKSPVIINMMRMVCVTQM